MKKTLMAMGLALAFSQGAMAAQAETDVADLASPLSAIQALNEEELSAAFTLGEKGGIAVLSDDEMVETTGAKAKKTSKSSSKTGKVKEALKVGAAVLKANVGKATDADYALITKHDATLAKVQKGAKVVAVTSAVIVGSHVAAAGLVYGAAAMPAVAASAKLTALSVAGTAVANPNITKATIGGVNTLVNVAKNAVDQYKSTGRVDPGKLSQPLISGGNGMVRAYNGQ